jgi:cystathionine beta-synthase
VRDLLQRKSGEVEIARPDETLAQVAHRMNQLGISQMPVSTGNGDPFLMVHESDLLQSLVSGQCAPGDPVVRAAKRLQGRISPEDPISKLQKVFDADNVAVVVDDDRIVGIVSKIDVVEFLAEAAGRAS